MSIGDPAEFEAAVPLVNPLVNERCSPEGERTAVEPSHDVTLSRTHPGVTHRVQQRIW
jgi:hypothetical protein